MPHLQRAIAIHRRLAGAELVGTTLGDALERVAVAACLLDRRGRPVYVNRLARAVFDAGDGLSLNSAGLAASRPRDDRALRAAVAAALGPIRPDETATGGLVSVFRPSGRREYALIIARVRLTPLDVDPGSPAVAVFVSDPEVRPEASDETLVRLYGLTSAEARIASLLVTGLTVEDIRERVGVTVNTLRTHLKRIYSKTGTRGQADLVRLLLPMAAVSAVA